MTTTTAPVATAPSPLKERTFVEFETPVGPAVTHPKGHAEEFAAVSYLRRFGSTANPWAADEFFPHFTLHGKLYLGLSPRGQRSPFDEHSWPGMFVDGSGYLPRIRMTEKQDDGTQKEVSVSCLSLFANAFEVPVNGDPNDRIPLSQMPNLKRTVKYLTEQDQGAPGRVTDLPNMVKIMHLLPELDDQGVFDWFDTALRAREDEQNATFARDDYGTDVLQFLIRRSYGDSGANNWNEQAMAGLAISQRLFETAREELLQVENNHTYTLRLGPEGHLLRAGCISSDNPKIGAASRSAGVNWDVIIQHHPISGHVQLYTNKRWNHDQGDKLLDALVPQLHIAEQTRRVELGIEPYVYQSDPELLRREGNSYPHSPWYTIYGMSLNGSITAPDVSATTLELPEIWDLLIGSLYESGFQDP